MKEKTVSRIRAFNRFYLPRLDLLGDHYLGSEYSAAEARILYEVLEHDGCNAAFIARELHLDKSYLSRVIRSHERRGYLTREKSSEDSRAYRLRLTDEGRARTLDFIRKSNEQIGDIIAGLSGEECQALMAALDTVTAILREVTE